MSKKNARILGIRLDENEAASLQDIENCTGMAPVSIVRAATKAVIKRWNDKRQLVLPFHIVDDSKADRPPKTVEKSQPYTVNAGPTSKAAKTPINMIALPPQNMCEPDQTTHQPTKYGYGKSQKKSG